MSDSGWLQLELSVAKEQLDFLEGALLELGAVAISLLDGADEAVFEVERTDDPVWSQVCLQALFSGDQEIEVLSANLSVALADLDPESWQLNFLPDQNWLRIWMDRYEPLCFGERLWVCPSWKEAPESAQFVLKLDPGMAFGTGTHPTTTLCLEWLVNQSLQGLSLVDYGCGSGILAIAALVMGAEFALAVDNDPLAVKNCRENADSNSFSVAKLKSVGIEEVNADDYKSDLIVANILSGPLVQLAPVLEELSVPGGQLILSGLLAEQIEDVTNAYKHCYDFSAPAVKDGWAMLHAIHH